MKLIPGEGLKLFGFTRATAESQLAPNEANPWRGIETHLGVEWTAVHIPAPNEANPWRGIETRGLVDGNARQLSPNEANPWRGIETRSVAGATHTG